MVITLVVIHTHQVIDVVLVIAAGLSVQSPFHRAAMREEQARVGIDKSIENHHFVPFCRSAC